MPREPLILLVFTIIFGLSACASAESERSTKPNNTNKSKCDRYFGLSVNETNSVKFADAYQKAQKLGVNIATFPVPWDEVEKSPFQCKNNLVNVVNQFYRSQDKSICLEINPIDTNNLRVPKDLQNQKFNSAKFISRFKHSLKWCLTNLPDVKIRCIVIGNEIDGYLHSADSWRQYLAFFKNIKGYVHNIKPSIPVGTKITLSGILNSPNKNMNELIASSDVLMTTYYPLNPDFTVKPPGSIHKDLRTLLTRYPKKDIYLLEWGYPTSKVVNSNEDKQALFVKETFKAWDQNKNRIKLINFVWMNEMPSSNIDKFRKYYRLNDRKFLGFLSSLGFCTESGSNKKGYLQIQRESRERGW